MTTTQIYATIPNELALEIKEMAHQDSRTFSQQVSLLLQRSVRDIKRKRKNGKKDDIEYNPSDTR